MVPRLLQSCFYKVSTRFLRMVVTRMIPCVNVVTSLVVTSNMAVQCPVKGLLPCDMFVWYLATSLLGPL